MAPLKKVKAQYEEGDEISFRVPYIGFDSWLHFEATVLKDMGLVIRVKFFNHKNKKMCTTDIYRDQINRYGKH